jgi:conjugal transfer pilus assembly protein TrbC
MTSLCGASAFAGATSQSPETGLDLQHIRANAARNAADAEALAAQARKRASALTKDAADNATTARENGQHYATTARATAKSGTDTFDFDNMVADAGSLATASLGEAPRFIAFASLSMPPQALRSMIAEVGKAGGAVVLRGLPGNSAKELTKALVRIAQPGEKLPGLGIDPRLFRAFRIDAVPTYVVVSSDFDLCDGFDCTDIPPPHDRISGNVSARYALETFAEGHGPGASLATQYLQRLGDPTP